MEVATERGEGKGREGKTGKTEMESGGGVEEGFPMRPWTLFSGTRDAEWDGTNEDETIPLLEGEDIEILQDNPLHGWPGPWNPEEMNLLLNEAKRPLPDPLAAGEVLWDNFYRQRVLVKYSNKPFPCCKVTRV